MDVVILYEKAARELDVACALVNVLQRRHGLKTEIVQQNYPQRRALRDLRPSIVVLPFCYQQRSNNQFLLQWRGATYFNMTWEQLFYPGNSKAKTPRGTFAVRHVVHNAWSPAYVDFLLAQGVPRNHILLSGNPAYALYDEPYRLYFKSRTELASAYGLDESRRWIFFPENYNWAFYDQSMLDQMIQDGQPATQVASMRDVVTRAFEEAMHWCFRLATAGEVELIVRPRPSTPSEVFAARVTETLGRLPPGMTIIGEETVRDWILASDVVMSSYSTSLIEASIAGRPAYLVEPARWPTELHQAWHDLAPRLTSEHAFIDTATRGGDPADAAPLAKWARGSMLSRGDPIVLIGDHLARIRAGTAASPGRPPWRAITLPSRWPVPSWAAYGYRRWVKPHLPRAAAPIADEYRADVAAAATILDRVRRWHPFIDPYLATFERP